MYSKYENEDNPYFCHRCLLYPKSDDCDEPGWPSKCRRRDIFKEGFIAGLKAAEEECDLCENGFFG